MYKCGFIGCGNMGGTLARAAIKSLGADRVLVSDRDGAKIADMASETGCTASDNATIARECDYIFLGVKPQMMGALAVELAPELKLRGHGFVLVSMAAGVSCQSISDMFGHHPVVRIMPDIPACVGEGMTLCAKNDLATDENVAEVGRILSRAGAFDMIPESMIDAGCALSGCGPAFVYMFIEALADGGVECGLPRDKALKYAAQTVLGSAKTVLECGKHPGELKDAVCSPGGSTIAGVHALEGGAFRGMCMDAVEAAFIRTKELGKK